MASLNASMALSSSSGLRKSASAGSLAALAQPHAVAPQHAAVSRLARPPIPRSASHLALPGVSATPRHSGSGLPAVSHQAAVSPQSQCEQQNHNQQLAGEAAPKGHSGRPAAAPYASLTRVFLIGQPSNFVRSLAGRQWRAAGPVSLLLFLAALFLSIMGAVRSVLVRRVKACKCCKGYGITRCRLCDGAGTVEWAGKNNHQEVCPLCMAKRFVTCSECGGFHHRKTFIHLPSDPRGQPEMFSNS